MNPLQQIVAKRQAGVASGIPSYCTAHPDVIAACLRHAKGRQLPVLIEATANQVNQYGGYTGMQPLDFRNRVETLAQEHGYPIENLIFGGDHLGPLTWQNEAEATSMAKAEELVRLFAAAGYQKIHLDTSMRLADDPVDQPLSTETIARRGARLCRAAEEGFQQYKEKYPAAAPPVYIIGSEVPIPGGAQEEEEGIEVTAPTAFDDTIQTYCDVFLAEGLDDAWKNVIAVVVQPGVEFGDEAIFQYDPEKAAQLVQRLSDHPALIFEGHSTDYQPTRRLEQMVADGIGILKVGPALTFALREALFALEEVEKNLLPADQCSHFSATLEEVMNENPGYWQKYYQGTPQQIALKRKYSFSDRCRYYLALPPIEQAIRLLMRNIDESAPPLNLLHQYLPIEARAILAGDIPARAADMIYHYIEATVLDDYWNACAERPLSASK